MTIDIDGIYSASFPELKRKFELKPFQREVIANILEKGSTIAIMPTGGGKSLIYWLAAKALKKTAIVISPLIALIDEQADKLRQEGCSVLSIHSGVNSKEQIADLSAFATGKSTPEFIFLSPERIATDGFVEYCIGQRKASIGLITIDEVHCISQWGFDFRPFYKRIPFFLNRVFGGKCPPILGLTATINPRELKDVLIDFNISRNNLLKADILLRNDITLFIEKFTDEESKEDRLWDLLDEHRNVKTLVYLYRKYHKRGVEDLTKIAEEKGFQATAFHGDMDGGDRQEVLKNFREGRSNVIFATNAFGMGIDIPDIRLVIHFMIPESVEQYYQEVGRAGRDGNGSLAYLLYTNKNIKVRRTHFIDKSFPKIDEIPERFTKTTNNQQGIRTLQYFQDEEVQETLPFFLNCGAIQIKGTGFARISALSNTKNKELLAIIENSKSGLVVPILKRPPFKDQSLNAFFDLFYKGIANSEIKVEKQIEKCLIIEAADISLTEEQLHAIDLEITQKRLYKHNLLDYLVYLLDNFDDSKKLHQEIGRYLGVPKHLLGKIYETESGIWVRSKSELIIANCLFQENIEFEYEQKLYYSAKQWKEPDFTIQHNGKTWIWEHLGMLGDEEYNEDWSEKRAIYKKLNIKNLITTIESGVFMKIVKEKIKQIMVH